MSPTGLIACINIVLLLFAIHGVTSNARLSRGAKLGWCAFIVVIPLLGSIAYLVYASRRPRGGTTLVRRRSGWFFER
ncbi:PLDc N-terminal domain-containing protein [Microbacteriaceae bacterium VKM Ac-2854]|nr:PLDc N-terminal domain-containing protein [Microbacteriaceae bacterium VKM Ac-2854]